MLQVRISEIDGSSPVIIDRAANKKYSESINLSTGGLSFDLAKNDPKAEVLNPYTDGYTRRWEVWETDTNEMLDFGPIHQIDDGGAVWKVAGPGRAGFLMDFYKSKKTFYTPISELIEDLSFENVAIQPRASTLVPELTTSANQTAVFGDTVIINDKYHALSKQTKDNVIDDDNGRILPGQIEPPNTFYSSDTFWSGMSKADTHIIDLGAVYEIRKVVHVFPDWGGPRRSRGRAFDFEISIATDTGTTIEVQDREFGDFTAIYTSPVPNREILGPTYAGFQTVYIGNNNGSIEVSDSPLDLPPVDVRYIRTAISNVYSWHGTNFDEDPPIDLWEYECNPDYVQGSIPSIPGKARMKEPINDRTLEPANDCHASIIEVGAYKEIIPLDNVKYLALQRIDNNNRQIRYTYNPVAGKTFTTDSGYRKFEPGSLFRKMRLTWSGAGTAYTKFFDDDCDGCFPDGFNLGIMDQNNSLVLATDSTSGTEFGVTLPATTKHVLIKGASNATVTWCDAWPARTDAFSWGGSYSFNEIVDDAFVVHFRGQSFRWYATVPANKTGAEVTVQIRSKTGSTWTSYSTLSTFTLPSDISSQPVFEITYESGTLQPNTTYEIRVNNNDGNFCSIDSIEGYWEASMTEYNEDSSRIFIAYPEKIKQIYDKRFSNGSMYKWDEYNWFVFGWVGDRVIITSAKGRNHGRANIAILDKTIGNIYDPDVPGIVPIPGGNPDGTLTVDLDTGTRGNEVPQYIVFDSADYFPDGLPWAHYTIGFYLLNSNIETYTSNTADIEFDSFVPRCKDCTPPTGDAITVNKPIFFDGIYAHERIGLSVQFDNETHLDILRSVIEVLQVEATAGANGLSVEPRIGQDTNIMLREGENLLVNNDITNDLSQMATMLVSSGADIDGLPLFTITENKNTRRRLGRTIMRQQDFRSVADYMQLVGLSRSELERRAYPQKRIRVTHIGSHLSLGKGDSFLLWTKKLGAAIRVRIETKEIDESSGRVFHLECITWPQIV